MRYAAHGGHCCGIVHISDFNWWDFEDAARAMNALNAAIERVLAKRYGFSLNSWRYGWLKPAQRQAYLDREKPAWNCLIEVVLTDHQCEQGWEDVLVERGFKRVTRFRNSNSGNWCNVFHLQTAQQEEKK